MSSAAVARQTDRYGDEHLAVAIDAIDPLIDDSYRERAQAHTREDFP